MRTVEEIEGDLRRANSGNDAERLIALASEIESIGTPAAEAAAYNARGTAAKLTGDYASALKHYVHALALSEELGNRAVEASLTVNIGIVYKCTSDYSAALEYYRRARVVFEELDDRASMAIVDINIGGVCDLIGDRAAALEHYRKALAVVEELGDRGIAAIVTGNLGLVHSGLGDYPSALEQYRRALAMHEELGNRAGAASVTGKIGVVYSIIGDYPSALEYYRRALTLHEELANRLEVANDTSNIGGVYGNIGDHSSALEYYRRALTLHEEIGNRSGIARAINAIGILHSKVADHPAAQEHHRRALALHEELGERASVAKVTGDLIETLLKLAQYDEAAALLEHQATLQMDDPGVRSSHNANRASVAEYREDLDAAQRYLLLALSIASEAGLRAEEAEYRAKLRDLAQKRGDFAGYIEQNNEYNRITEEIRGVEATQKLAMMEAERKVEAELRERDKERALLYGALPKEIADRMLRGETVSGDHFDHAAVLFMDVVGFTTNSSSMPPGDVVQLLALMFNTFDDLCIQHNVMKVKTIGDSYMCFKGDATAIENATSLASLARAMIATSFTWPNGEPLAYRIGMHIGPATAGVIGTQRLQYDVWGDTVNVASRMESHGEPGRIHVSDAFATALRSEGGGQRAEDDGNDSMTPGSMTLLERGSIDIKGKGPMTTYWLS